MCSTVPLSVNVTALRQRIGVGVPLCAAAVLPPTFAVVLRYRDCTVQLALLHGTQHLKHLVLKARSEKRDRLGDVGCCEVKKRVAGLSRGLLWAR